MIPSTDIVLIAGSPSLSSRSTAALEYVGYTLRSEQQSTHTIYARDLLAASLSFGNPLEHPLVKEAIAAVSSASGVVIATPIYQGAYSGVLKAFLDLLPEGILARKVVFPIASGGSLAHLLAIDYALKPVLSALGAREILQGVYLTDAQIARAGEGSTAYSRGYRLEEAAEARLHDGATALLHAVYGPPVRSSRELAGSIK